MKERPAGGQRGENLGDSGHGGWDSKEKRCVHLQKVSVYCRMQFPLFITISSRALKKTDTNQSWNLFLLNELTGEGALRKEWNENPDQLWFKWAQWLLASDPVFFPLCGPKSLGPFLAPAEQQVLLGAALVPEYHGGPLPKGTRDLRRFNGLKQLSLCREMTQLR